MPEFDYLQQNRWEFTEKCDGTNIRVSPCVFPDGRQVMRFGGRTDAAQIPTRLLTHLQSIFSFERFTDDGPTIFDQPFSADTMQGMLLNLKLDTNGGITIRKDIVKLNSAFQPDKVITRKEEKIKFQEIKPN